MSKTPFSFDDGLMEFSKQQEKQANQTFDNGIDGLSDDLFGMGGSTWGSTSTSDLNSQNTFGGGGNGGGFQTPFGTGGFSNPQTPNPEPPRQKKDFADYVMEFCGKVLAWLVPAVVPVLRVLPTAMKDTGLRKRVLQNYMKVLGIYTFGAMLLTLWVGSPMFFVLGTGLTTTSITVIIWGTSLILGKKPQTTPNLGSSGNGSKTPSNGFEGGGWYDTPTAQEKSNLGHSGASGDGLLLGGSTWGSPQPPTQGVSPSTGSILDGNPWETSEESNSNSWGTSSWGDEDIEEDEGYDNSFGDDIDESQYDDGEDDRFNVDAYLDNIGSANFDSKITTQQTTVSAEEIDQLASSLNDIPKELLNRGLYFDKFVSMLPSNGVKADWSREIPADSDEAMVLKTGILVIQRAQNHDESLWVKRVLWAREKLLRWEFAVEKGKLTEAQVSAMSTAFSKYISRDYSQHFGTNCEATMEVIGERIEVTISRHIKETIYLRSLLEANREFFVNSDSLLPVVAGVSSDGSPILIDMGYGENSSIALLGKGRGGKSVMGTNLVTQMVALNPPSKVQFYISDMKDGNSDWEDIKAPHVRRIVRNDVAGTLDMIRYINDVEVPKRNELFRNAVGVKKIQDYNKKFPDNPMPYIYIIIDEMVSMFGSATKEQAQELKSLMETMVTRLPAHGIFFIFIPHYLHNDVIPKKIHQVLSSKFAFSQDEQTLKTNFQENARGVHLETKGVGSAIYMTPQQKSLSLMQTPLMAEDMTNIQNGLAKMWESLEPSFIAGSHSEQVKQTEILRQAKENQNQILQSSFKDDNLSWLDGEFD